MPRSKATKLGANAKTVRWKYISKDDAINENYRLRPMAREIKKDDTPDLFAATPPSEASEVITSMCASNNKGETIMVNDVSRACFSAPAKMQVFVALSGEDRIDGENIVGELTSSMYGPRDAAQNWVEECAPAIENVGFHRGTASPCTFSHPQR